MLRQIVVPGAKTQPDSVRPLWAFLCLEIAVWRSIASLSWDHPVGCSGPSPRKMPPVFHMLAHFPVPCVLFCILESPMNSAVLGCGVFQTADQDTVGALRGEDAFFDHSRV